MTHCWKTNEQLQEKIKAIKCITLGAMITIYYVYTYEDKRVSLRGSIQRLSPDMSESSSSLLPTLKGIIGSA